MLQQLCSVLLSHAAGASLQVQSQACQGTRCSASQGLAREQPMLPQCCNWLGSLQAPHLISLVWLEEI